MRNTLFLASFAVLLLASQIVYAEEVDTARELRAEKRQERRDDFKERKSELASKAAQMREDFKERREAFKEKLSELKDKRKEKIVQNVDLKIDALNKRHTIRMGEVLERLNDVLVRLDAKVTTASTEGKDVASASAAIATAKTAVSTAQIAVSDQSAKDYAPVITDETTLGAVVSKAFQDFRTDIQAVHKLVINAKQAVRSAAVIVLQLK